MGKEDAKRTLQRSHFPMERNFFTCIVKRDEKRKVQTLKSRNTLQEGKHLQFSTSTNAARLASALDLDPWSSTPEMKYIK